MWLDILFTKLIMIQNYNPTQKTNFGILILTIILSFIVLSFLTVSLTLAFLFMVVESFVYFYIYIIVISLIVSSITGRILIRVTDRIFPLLLSGVIISTLSAFIVSVILFVQQEFNSVLETGLEEMGLSVHRIPNIRLTVIFIILSFNIPLIIISLYKKHAEENKRAFAN